MGLYLLRRTFVSVLVLFIVTIAIFAMVRLAPGDPLSMMIDPELVTVGGEEYLDRLRSQLGLDQPLPGQYVAWLQSALSGDLGFSYATKIPVTTLLWERLGPTALLMCVALIIAVVVAVPLGVLAAVKRNSTVDHTVTALSLLVISIPSFFIALIAIYLFSLTLGLLPSAGLSTPGDGSIGDIARHIAMPGTILGLVVAGPLARYVRAGLIGELSADYMRTAYAKGAGPARAVFMHALPNTLIPLVTVVVLYIPGLLAGAVVLEQVFSWPGMGQLAVSSISKQDYPVVVGFALFVAVIVVVVNLIADIIYSVVDPRVRLS